MINKFRKYFHNKYLVTKRFVSSNKTNRDLQIFIILLIILLSILFFTTNKKEVFREIKKTADYTITQSSTTKKYTATLNPESDKAGIEIIEDVKKYIQEKENISDQKLEEILIISDGWMYLGGKKEEFTQQEIDAARLEANRRRDRFGLPPGYSD